MTLPHPIPEPLAELIARRFRVIGEPMRIRLLDRLREGEATVQELTEALAASQQNVSKHLQVLLEAGVRAVVQPGGSVRDEEVITAARDAGVTLYLTGTRHFAH